MYVEQKRARHPAWIGVSRRKLKEATGKPTTTSVSCAFEQTCIRKNVRRSQQAGRPLGQRARARRRSAEKGDKDEPLDVLENLKPMTLNSVIRGKNLTRNKTTSGWVYNSHLLKPTKKTNRCSAMR